mgnify:CR=1 FL=1
MDRARTAGKGTKVGNTPATETNLFFCSFVKYANPFGSGHDGCLIFFIIIVHCFRASVKYRPFFLFAHFLFSGRWRRRQRWRTGKRVRTFWLSRGGRVLAGRVFFRNWNQRGRVRWESDFCFDVKLNLAQVKRAMGYKLATLPNWMMPLLEWKVLVWRDHCRFERRLRSNRIRLESLRPERVLGTLQVFLGCRSITSTMCFNPQY